MMPQVVRSDWSPHLDCYCHLDAITFESEADYRAVLKLFWSPGTFYGVPRDIISSRTIVVPEEVVKLLKSERFKFRHSRVLSASELSASERAQLRHRGA
jgi:hypothetical protein